MELSKEAVVPFALRPIPFTCDGCGYSELEALSLNEEKGVWCMNCIRVRSAYEESDPVLTHRARRRAERRELVAKLKLESGCQHCGYRESTKALDYHHLDPSTKEAKVGVMIKNDISLERVLAEVDKCKVLCANCHWLEHRGQERSV